MILFTKREQIIADLFILDDLTPLGVKVPQELFDCFKKSDEVKVLNAEELALETSDLIKEIQANPLIVGGGGILTYALMSRFYYKRNLDIVKIKRIYYSLTGQKRPMVRFEIEGKTGDSRFCIDDIIASGLTIAQIGSNLDCATLLTSMQCRGTYRKREGSTIMGVNRLFTAQGVNGTRGFPAIFSMRFIAKQMPEQREYQDYVSKYADVSRLLEIVKEIDKRPLDLLYDDPIKFIRNYGG